MCNNSCDIKMCNDELLLYPSSPVKYKIRMQLHKMQAFKYCNAANYFIYWWQELALYMKCVIASMFHWINGVSRGKMKFREEKWIWLIFPHETPFFLCETSFFRTKIHLSNEARNFDSLSLTETAFTKLKLYTVAQFIYQCLARPGSLTCWTSRVLIRYPVDSR